MLIDNIAQDAVCYCYGRQRSASNSGVSICDETSDDWQDFGWLADVDAMSLQNAAELFGAFGTHSSILRSKTVIDCAAEQFAGWIGITHRAKNILHLVSDSLLLVTELRERCN